MTDRPGLPDLSPQDKRALLAALLREKAGAGPASYPLAHGQRALWFLHQLAPSSSAYNVAFAARLRSDVDPGALRRALQTLVDRHPCLRTVFASEEELVQRVQARRAAALETIDAARMADDELRRAVVAAHRRPFDLAAGPLFRASLFSRSPREHVLLLGLHHIVADGASLIVLLDELARAYAASRTGHPAALPPVGAPYRAFVEAERALIASEEGQRMRGYWEKRLAGDPPVLAVPTDRARPSLQTYDGGLQALRVEPDLAQGLKALALRERVTLFTVCLAAFQVLLHRYSGQEEILVGSPTVNRARADFERTVGHFVNPVVLRADLESQPPFQALLDQVRQTVLGAIAHERYPFPLLVEHLRPARDPSRSPFFQAMFAFQNLQRLGDLGHLLVPVDTGRVVTYGGLEWSPFPVGQQEGQFDLSLEIEQLADDLFAIFKFNTDLFDASTIARMAAHFHELLRGIVSAPDTPVGKLPMLTRHEREALAARNATEAPYPAGARVHGLVEAQVARTPTAVAVAAEGETLTYEELDRRANRLGHRLRAAGVGRGTLVGVCLERTPAMVVAALGILKAGAAYVPLDPAYPAERLAFMIADAPVAAVLVEERTRERVRATGASLLTTAETGATGDANPPAAGAPEDLAYVIYTSGSTGRPKGVEVTHRSVVNFLTSMRVRPGLAAGDVLLSVTTLSFDIAALELYLPLSVGARVVLASREAAADGRRLADLLGRADVTAMQATPATWRLLLEAGWPGTPGLKMLCGGEALPRELAEALLARGGELWNMYGPTETTIWSAVERVESATGPVSLGGPIANTQIHVLDAWRQPVPAGVAGEIYIGGAGVARGYRNRPELTPERFVPDPFVPGARLYRTGDLARYRHDGALEFLGRMDHQVKVRGFRIEPGEIESALRQLPDVRDAVVIAREDRPGDRRLTAYVVTEGAAVTAEGTQAGLRRTLPDYMVPASFVLLDALPMTPNGKVDRRALPAPNTDRGARRSAVAPRDAVERRLVALWERVLGVAPIGATDNFFDHGGHSLLAVRLFNEVEKAFGRRLPLATLFQAPTVEQLAGVLRSDAAADAGSSLVAIQAGGARSPFFCVHGHGGHVLFYNNLARHLGPEQPFYGLQARGLDGRSTPDGRIEDMAVRYLSEIRAVQPRGPYLLAGYCFGGLVAFEMAQQLVAQGEAVGLLALIDTYGPPYLALPAERIGVVSLLGRAVRRIDYEVGNLRLLDSSERVPYLVDKVRRVTERTRWTLGRYVGKEDPLDRIRRVQAAHVPAIRAYAPRPYCGRLVLLKASKQPLGVAADLGWGGYGEGGIEIREIPGYQAAMFEEPSVRVLAHHLRQWLAGAESRGAES